MDKSGQNKQHHGTSFLDKFKGKTSVIGKRGITDLFQNGGEQHQPPSAQHSEAGGSRRPSVYRQRSLNRPLELPRPTNLDSVLPPLKKLQPLLTGRSRLPNQQHTRQNSEDRGDEPYIPSFVVSKSTNIVGGNKHAQSQALATPLSTRRTIHQREQLSRYNDYSLEKNLITNNTKVYEDAFKHLQFLNLIETRMKGGNR